MRGASRRGGAAPVEPRLSPSEPHTSGGVSFAERERPGMRESTPLNYIGSKMPLATKKLGIGAQVSVGSQATERRQIALAVRSRSPGINLGMMPTAATPTCRDLGISFPIQNLV